MRTFSSDSHPSFRLSRYVSLQECDRLHGTTPLNFFLMLAISLFIRFSSSSRTLAPRISAMNLRDHCKSLMQSSAEVVSCDRPGSVHACQSPFLQLGLLATCAKLGSVASDRFRGQSVCRDLYAGDVTVVRFLKSTLKTLLKERAEARGVSLSGWPLKLELPINLTE